ncbi:MAG: MBL fold metallo-hydrolase [Alphaproteobacteria bacterium BRH_c36]|nr:MAG: MBL fold metallo-hydrolase [Alphaproteobacteria bacterium BRH_c36]
MKLTIVGSGDAFGSGGRLQTCFHVATGEFNFLIDCGASSLIGMERAGLDPAGVDAIFISHLHGDHFAGLIWWILYARHVEKRTRPLVIVGPQGIEARYVTTAEALFPGSTEKETYFDLQFHEHDTAAPFEWRGLSCTAIEVCHPSGAPSHGLRFEFGDKALSYSGDTEWVDGLFGLSEGVDLHINECFAYTGGLRYHTNWLALREKLGDITASRILLTHMSRPMLAHLQDVEEPRVMIAHDGLVIEV